MEATAATNTTQAPTYSCRNTQTIWQRLMEPDQSGDLATLIGLKTASVAAGLNISNEWETFTMRTSSQRLAAVRKSEAMLLASVNCSNLCLNRGSYLPPQHHKTSGRYCPASTGSNTGRLKWMLLLSYYKEVKMTVNLQASHYSYKNFHFKFY